jgi:hypothetical protein
VRQEEVLMISFFETFQKDGEVKFEHDVDFIDLVSALAGRNIPFCVVYDGNLIVVRSIDYTLDDGK